MTREAFVLDCEKETQTFTVKFMDYIKGQEGKTENKSFMRTDNMINRILSKERRKKIQLSFYLISGTGRTACLNTYFLKR